jgi:hypothetical protein
MLVTLENHLTTFYGHPEATPKLPLGYLVANR